MWTTLRNAHLPRLMEHLRSPLYRNGYALVISSGATSALGFIYWILAAQNYSTETVGLNSAILSAVMFLANVSQLNLGNAFNRFLPSSGRQSRSIILYTYALTSGVACIVAALFLLGLNAWAPQLNILYSSPLLIIGFILSVVAWLIFILQDSALVGLRQATWVPFENIIFAVAKVLLLIILASLLPDFGIMVSWIVPVMILLLPVNYLIFRRLLPRHIEDTQDRAVPVSRAQITRYVTGDYLGSIISTATVDLLPIIIVERVTASANAFFFLSWTIAYALYLFSRNMGMSLIAEAAIEPTKLYIYSYRIFVQTARILVPLVLVGVIGAPLILRLFGDAYAAEAPDLLRLLCLSAIPNIIVQTYLSIARVQRRVSALILVQGFIAIAVLGQVFLLLDVFGITAIGIAWLSTQTLVAVFLLLTQLRTAWIHEVNLSFVLSALALPRRLWWSWKHRGDVANARQLLPALLPALSVSLGGKDNHPLDVQRLLPTLNEVSVMTVGRADEPEVAVLKVSRSTAAAASLKRQYAILQTLREETCLGDWQRYLPEILAVSERNGQVCLSERLMQGTLATVFIRNSDARAAAQDASLRCIAEFHERTQTLRTVDDAFLSHRISRLLDVLHKWNVSRKREETYAQNIDRLGAELHRMLSGRTVALSWVHGDYSPDNIMMSNDGLQVSGVMDWELAQPDELPQLDVMQFLLSCRMLVRKQELGDVLRDLLLNNSKWSPHEQSAWESAQAHLVGDALNMRTMLLFAWLRHVTDNLEKSTHYAAHWLWTTKNLEGVLKCI